MIDFIVFDVLKQVRIIFRICKFKISDLILDFRKIVKL